MLEQTASSLDAGPAVPLDAGPAAPAGQGPGRHWPGTVEERAGGTWIWQRPGPRPGPAVAFDIDGVLSDCSARQRHLRGPKPDWEAFLAEAGQDPLSEGGARVLDLLVPSLTVVLLTGRPARVAQATLAWLDRHHLRWDVLVMRSDADRRPASQFKTQAVRALQADGLDIKVCFEDDERTVSALRALGLPTLHVHSGYYG